MPSARASILNSRYVSSNRSVVRVSKDGEIRKTIILTTYLEDQGPEYEALCEAAHRHFKDDDTVDSIEIYFPERV